MIVVAVPIHLLLLSFEIGVYYILKENGLLLDIQYVLNEMDYYKELPIVNITIIITLILFAIGVILAVACLNKRINFFYVLFYLGLMPIIFFILKSKVEGQIKEIYGAEFFSHNFYLYFIGLVIFWSIIVCSNFVIEKYIEKLVVRQQ
jgi:hypothetical protein